MAYIDKETYALVKLITDSYDTKSNHYHERNFVKINNSWYLGSVIYKHYRKRTTTTLYNYLGNSKDLTEKFYPTHGLVGQRSSGFNKDQNDTF